MRNAAWSRLPLRLTALAGLAAGFGAASCDNSTQPGSLVVAMSVLQVVIADTGSSTYLVTATRSGDFTGEVTFAVTGAPPGATVVISNVRTAGRVTSADVTLTVTDAVTPGVYGLDVRAAGASLTATVRFIVTVDFGRGRYAQWASTASASSQYTSAEWSASEATGQPNVTGCVDDPRAWASLAPDGIEWLELTFPDVVRPLAIRIHEVFGVSSIVKVEVKDPAGAYHTVFDGVPLSRACPRILVVPVTGISEFVNVVRVSFDQRLLKDWNEIDAVQLIGSSEGYWDYLRGSAVPGR